MVDFLDLWLDEVLHKIPDGIHIIPYAHALHIWKIRTYIHLQELDG